MICLKLQVLCVFHCRYDTCLACTYSSDVSQHSVLHVAYRCSFRNDSEGQEILRDKPFITEESIRYEELRSYPEGSLGREYVRFMDRYGFHASERALVKYIDDEDLAYVMTRYRQIHDFQHVLWGLNVSVEAEVVLKCIEMLQTQLPVSVHFCSVV